MKDSQSPASVLSSPSLWGRGPCREDTGVGLCRGLQVAQGSGPAASALNHGASGPGAAAGGLRVGFGAPAGLLGWGPV